MCDLATMALGAGKGALQGLNQNVQQRANPGQPYQQPQGDTLFDTLMNKRKNRIGALPTSKAPMNPLTPGASPMGQPNGTQAPQGSSTNDDMPNQLPGFGYRPQQGGFGDEDFLRKYFGGMGGGSQGFNG